MKRDPSDEDSRDESDLEKIRQDLRLEVEDEDATNSIPIRPLRLSRLECCCRILVLLMLITCIALIIVDCTTTKYIQSDAITFIAWLGENPVEGVLAVIGMISVGTVLFVPANILTVGVGFAFHAAFLAYHRAVVLGSIAAFVGAFFGSIFSFLLGRYLLRAPVVSMASHYPLFRAIDSALGEYGLKIMFLLRLSPLIPYNILDYLSGVTAIPLWKFSLALFGMLPGTIMFVAIGAAASSLAGGANWVEENRAVRISVICVGLVFTVGGVALASYYSKLELEKILREQRRGGSNRNMDPASIFGLEMEGDDLDSTRSLTSSQA